MERVQMVYMGKMAEVDADQVKKLQRKEALVTRMKTLKKMAELGHGAAAEEASDLASKIIRLNRSIRQTVQFL